MKTILLLILALSLSASRVLAASQDDLILQTRVDPASMTWLVEKTRIIMNNAEISDGLSDTVSIDDVSFNLESISNDPYLHKTLELVSNIFKVDARNATVRVRIPKISYRLHSLKVKPKRLHIEDPNLELETGVAIQGVDIGLPSGVQLDFMLMNPATEQLASYFTTTVEPTLVTIPESVEAAQFEVDFLTIRDKQFNFELKKYNLDNLPIYVENHIKDIINMAVSTGKPITADQIRVNPVIVKLSQLTRTIKFDDFKPYVQEKLPEILGAVFKAVGNSLKSTIGPRILTKVFSLKTRSDLVVSNANLYTRFSVANFSQSAPDQLSLGVAGDLCTNELYQRFHTDCVSHMETMGPVRTIPSESRIAARQEFTQKIESGLADVGMSISEEYLNRLLQTTIDANLWNSMLQENHLKIGPKGIFVVLNQANQTPELFLDLYYTGEGGLTGVIINERHPIRFPLRMSTNVNFENREGVPHMVITTDKLLSDANEIINGIPEYDMQSQLVWGFKRKIARMVIEMATKLEGRSALDMEIPVFQGVGLEKTWHETSQFGRINLYFKL